MLKTKPWIILAGFALLSVVLAIGVIRFSLYVPTLGSDLGSQQEQEKSAKSSEHTKGKAGSSEKHPVFVKTIPADTTPDEARHRAYEEKEKPELERWLTYATIGLAVFTFCLFVGTGVLAIYTFRLWDDAKNTSERQADEMNKSLALAEKQMALVGLQVDNAIKQTAINREEFFATHRPKIILRAVRLDIYKAPNYLSIQYTIANAGESAAKIVRYNVQHVITSAIELPHPLIKEGGTDFDQIMNSGDWYTMPAYTELKADILNDLEKEKCRLFLIGKITYLDNMERKRHMGFCRRLNPSDWRFYRLDNTAPYEEYEYSD